MLNRYLQPVSTAILFTIAKIWKPPLCTNEWMDRQTWHTEEYYSAIKEENLIIYNNRDGSWRHCAKWNIRQKKKNTMWCHTHTHTHTHTHIYLIYTPWTVAHQVPLSMGCSQQEYWSRLPFPPPEDLPDQGIKPRSPVLQEILYQLSHQSSWG